MRQPPPPHRPLPPLHAPPFPPSEGRPGGKGGVGERGRQRGAKQGAHTREEEGGGGSRRTEGEGERWKAPRGRGEEREVTVILRRKADRYTRRHGLIAECSETEEKEGLTSP